VRRPVRRRVQLGLKDKHPSVRKLEGVLDHAGGYDPAPGRIHQEFLLSDWWSDRKHVG
jgi:hypothetical protein